MLALSRKEPNNLLINKYAVDVVPTVADGGGQVDQLFCSLTDILRLESDAYYWTVSFVLV
jgi:hypothetical protein